MPGRYRHRKKAPRTRNRRYRRHRYPHPRTTRVPTGAAPLAKKHIVKLKYAEVVGFTISAGSTSIQAYNLNSLFDPDRTGVGHQPYGFDQLAALFAHYRVFKCAWHIEFAGSDDRLHVTVIPVNALPVTTAYSNIMEQPLAVTKALAFDGGFPTKFHGSVSLPKLTGATSTQYKTDDRYSAAVGASPTELMTLYIQVYNPTAGSVTTSANVTLIYYSEFYDPITLSAS